MSATTTLDTPTSASMRGRLPALAAPIACGCCLVTGAAYVVADNPSDGGVFLPCPFRALTGLWCPGCGMTRATHHLLRGDIAAALRFNVFVLFVLVAIAGSWLVWMLDVAGRRVEWARRVPAWAYAAAIATLLAFGVIRNLPGVPGLRG